MRKKYSKELIELRALIISKKNLIKDKKEYLSSTDYEAIKFAEGEISEEDYAPYKAERREARLLINQAEVDLLSLQQQFEEMKNNQGE